MEELKEQLKKGNFYFQSNGLFLKSKVLNITDDGEILFVQLENGC